MTDTNQYLARLIYEVKWCSPQIHVYPDLQGVIVFGNRVFVDVIIYDEIILG